MRSTISGRAVCKIVFLHARIHGISQPDNIFFEELSRLSVKPVVQQWKSYNQHHGSLRIGFRRQDSFFFMPFLWEQAARLKAEEVDCFANLTTVTLVGCGLENNPETAGRFSSIMHDNAPVVEQHEGNRLCFAVEKDMLKSSLETLHSQLAESF